MNPATLTGLSNHGGALPFLFSLVTMNAVGRAARRASWSKSAGSSRRLPAFWRNKAIRITAAAWISARACAQKEMVLPALTAIIFPILTGLLLGRTRLRRCLRARRFRFLILAIMMSNAAEPGITPRSTSGRQLPRQGQRRAPRGDCRDTGGRSVQGYGGTFHQHPYQTALDGLHRVCGIFSHGCLLNCSDSKKRLTKSRNLLS